MDEDADGDRRSDGMGEENGDGRGEGTGVGKKMKKRHLLRMRIRNQSLGWELPDALKEGWEEAFSDDGDMVWHLEPMPEGFFPLRKYPL